MTLVEPMAPVEIESEPSPLELAVVDPVTQALVDARERLSDPDKWTRDRYYSYSDAVDPFGRAAMAGSTCAVGAVGYALGYYRPGLHLTYPTFDADDPRHRIFIQALFHLRFTADGQPVEYYNDLSERTHAQVLAWFDRAIARSLDAAGKPRH